MVSVLDLVVWVESLLLIVNKYNRLVTSARICTHLVEAAAEVEMSRMNNLMLSCDKMAAVREIPSQTFPAVQSVVVSVKGED